MPQFPPPVLLRYDKKEYGKMYPAWQTYGFFHQIDFDRIPEPITELERMLFYFALWIRHEPFRPIYNLTNFLDLPYFCHAAISTVHDRFQLRIFLEKRYGSWGLTSVMWSSTHEPKPPKFDLKLSYEENCCS